MEDIIYKVKIRNFYGSYENYSEDEVLIPVPAETTNIDGFIKHVLGIGKRKDEMIQLIEYEENN